MQIIPLAEWLYEEGIGENRAMLIDKGRVTKIRIERNFGEFKTPKCGLITKAKLTKKHGNGGFITLDDGGLDDGTAIIKKWPQNTGQNTGQNTEGAIINVEIVRETLYERTRIKPAIAIASERDVRKAPTLRDNILSSQINVRQCYPHEGDIFAQYGWYELTGQAEQSLYNFADGRLIIDIVSAMTVIDVDGDADNLSLAKNAAKAAARAIILYDLQAMIGIDFPALDTKNDRITVAQIFDDAMEGPCERTAINGFGFMQIIMKQQRPSVIALLARNKKANIALDIMRKAENESQQYDNPNMQIMARPDIISYICQHGWDDILRVRTGKNWQLTQAPQYKIFQFDIFSNAI